jgi:integrase
MPKKRGNNEGTISRRKDGRFMARITIGRHPTTGTLQRLHFYGKTRQEVADQMAKALSDRGRGHFIAPHKITVGEWLITWLHQYKAPRVRPLTFDNYERVIRVHLVPAYGRLPLKHLSADHIQRLYTEKHKAGMAPGMIRLIHAVLRGALKQALKTQLIVRNVIEATELPGGPKRPIMPLALPQVHQLLTSIAHDAHYPAIFLSLAKARRVAGVAMAGCGPGCRGAAGVTGARQGARP